MYKCIYKKTKPVIRPTCILQCKYGYSSRNYMYMYFPTFNFFDLQLNL